MGRREGEESVRLLVLLVFGDTRGVGAVGCSLEGDVAVEACGRDLELGCFGREKGEMNEQVKTA